MIFPRGPLGKRGHLVYTWHWEKFKAGDRLIPEKASRAPLPGQLSYIHGHPTREVRMAAKRQENEDTGAIKKALVGMNEGLRMLGYALHGCPVEGDPGDLCPTPESRIEIYHKALQQFEEAEATMGSIPEWKADPMLWKARAIALRAPRALPKFAWPVAAGANESAIDLYKRMQAAVTRFFETQYDVTRDAIDHLWFLYKDARVAEAQGRDAGPTTPPEESWLTIPDAGALLYKLKQGDATEKACTERIRKKANSGAIKDNGQKGGDRRVCEASVKRFLRNERLRLQFESDIDRPGSDPTIRTQNNKF